MPPQIKQQITLMVRGGQSKNDNAQIDNLFRLTSPDWVSSKESEELRETIINNEWSKSGLQSTTVEQYRLALRKWLKLTSTNRCICKYTVCPGPHASKLTLLFVC